MAYKKPPLVELYVEVRFKPGTLSQANIIAIIPELSQLGIGDVNIGQSPLLNQTQIGYPQFSMVPRIRCLDKTKTRIVQFSPDLAIVDLVGDYPGWDTFEGFVSQVVGLISKIHPGAIIDSLNLVAKDAFSVAFDGFTIGRYLDCNGEVIPKLYSDIKSASDLMLGYGFFPIDGSNSQAKIAVRINKETVAITFETYCLKKLAETVIGTLRILHDELNRRFEAMITQETRNNVFGGLK
jgi:uncharacterized protein (TIGR04255 family)